MVVNSPFAFRLSPFQRYTFVDYSTQGYSALVGLLILFFHNATVTGWPWLVGAHALGIILVHLLIQWHACRQSDKLLVFFRHFYPLLFYTAFYRETGTINRMFFPDFMDPVAIRWEQTLFGGQPGVLFMQRLPYLLVSELFYASYFSYYLMIGGIGVALFLRDRRHFLHFLSVMSFLFYVCYMIYDLVPIVGPRVFFREVEGYTLPADCQQLATTDVYPDAIKVGIFFRIMAWIYRVFESPGAAFPSSHVVVAMCTVYFSFRRNS